MPRPAVTPFIAKTVKTEAAPDALAKYAWGRKDLYFARCKTCGCMMW